MQRTLSSSKCHNKGIGLVHERCVALPSIRTHANHAIIGEVNDLSTGRTLAHRLRRRSGVVRGDAHAPRDDRVVEL